MKKVGVTPDLVFLILQLTKLGKICYNSFRKKKGVASVKKIVSVMLVCVLVLGILPFASAEVGRVTPARCPACSDALIYRTYTVDFGHRTVTYRQASCPQHGDVYGAEELSAEVRHNWSGDYLYGGVVCGDCGKRGEVIVAVSYTNCPGEPIGHQWATNHLNGSAQCSLCDACWDHPLDEPLSKEDAVCPNHRTFHTWSVDEETGDIICETCGLDGLEIVVTD